MDVAASRGYYVAISAWEPGGTGGTCPSPFFKDLDNMPFSCNLVSLLESFEDSKITSKIHVSSDFRRAKYQNFPGSMLLGPLAN